MPLLGIRAHRSHHERKISLRGRIGYVARGACHVIEHKRLVASLQKSDGHRLLLVFAHMRKASATTNHHGRAQRVFLLGHKICQVGGIGCRVLRGGLVSPECMLLDNHKCSFTHGT